VAIISRMQTIRQQYIQFLTDNFKGLLVRTPLFYNWGFGLRFDLQVGDPGTNNYFIEMIKRASTLFQSAFDSSDQLFFVYVDYKYQRRKIKFSNYCFKQITNLKQSEVHYSKVRRLYEPNDKFDIRNIALIKLTTDRLNFKNVLTAIGHSDFPPREPRLDKNGIFTSKEIYFVNISKRLIFHMYDDRGLDIIATDIETLRPIYTKYNDWLLDHDRKIIDKVFAHS
jgi:hypothetical protein